MDDLKKDKEKHRLAMEKYAEQVREYIQENGNDNSEYLIYRRLMESYHRGAWNALNSVERS